MDLLQGFAELIEKEIQKHNSLPRSRRQRRLTILNDLKLAHDWLVTCGLQISPIKE